MAKKYILFDACNDEPLQMFDNFSGITNYLVHYNVEDNELADIVIYEVTDPKRIAVKPVETVKNFEVFEVVDDEDKD